MTDFASTRRLPGREPLIGRALSVKTGSTVKVEINGTVVDVQVARDVTVAADDPVIVQRTANLWVVTGRLFASAPVAPDNTAPPQSNPTTFTGQSTFAPVETRSRRNGAWRTDNTDVYQGSYGGGGNHTGAVFYGWGPRSLAGATVLSASMVVRRGGGGAYAAQTTNMWLVTEAFRPSGAPTLAGPVSGPSLPVNRDTSFVVPASWVQSMISGAAGGFGFFVSGGSPYVIFDGIGTWSPAFTLTINWSR